MIDDHRTTLADIDVVGLDRGGMRWINYDSSVDLNDFEKVHSGGSSDSYILRSLSCTWARGCGAKISLNHYYPRGQMGCYSPQGRWLRG